MDGQRGQVQIKTIDCRRGGGGGEYEAVETVYIDIHLRLAQ